MYWYNFTKVYVVTIKRIGYISTIMSEQKTILKMNDIILKDNDPGESIGEVYQRMISLVRMYNEQG